MLQTRLNADMIAAMKDREGGKIRLSVIRMVKSAMKNLQNSMIFIMTLIS